MFSTFLTEVMLIAGLGALLDNVFINSQERERIAKYLETGTQELPLNDRFSKFLERAHSIIFGRFFTARLFSFGFIASAASVSLVSFAIVIGVQAYLFPEQFSQLRLDSTQYGLFAAFIAFNILFDYVTIIQTKIFIEASLSAKSIFRAIVFICSDLIVTMNTFILSYAFFVLVVVQSFVFEPKSATVILSGPAPAQELDPTRGRTFLAEFQDADFYSKIQFSGAVSGALLPDENHDEAKKTLIYYYSTFDPQSGIDQASILTSVSSLNMSNVGFAEISDEDTLEEFSETLDGTRSELDRMLDKDSDERSVFALTFDVDGSVINNGSITGAYTAAFDLTDHLEDGFPASLVGPMELPLLSSLIESAVASPYPPLPTAVCFKDGAPILRLLISDQTIEALNQCEGFVAFELFWSNAFDKELALVGRDISGYRVPYNTLLITSVLPTAFFYLAILLLAIATLCFSKVIKGTNRFKKFFLRAPLAISGFLLGSVLSLTGLI